MEKSFKSTSEVIYDLKHKHSEVKKNNEKYYDSTQKSIGKKSLKNIRPHLFDVLGLDPIDGQSSINVLGQKVSTQEKVFAFGIDQRLYTTSFEFQARETDYNNTIKDINDVINYNDSVLK